MGENSCLYGKTQEELGRLDSEQCANPEWRKLAETRAKELGLPHEIYISTDKLTSDGKPSRKLMVFLSLGESDEDIAVWYRKIDGKVKKWGVNRLGSRWEVYVHETEHGHKDQIWAEIDCDGVPSKGSKWTVIPEMKKYGCPNVEMGPTMSYRHDRR